VDEILSDINIADDLDGKAKADLEAVARRIKEVCKSCGMSNKHDKSLREV